MMVQESSFSFLPDIVVSGRRNGGIQYRTQSAFGGYRNFGQTPKWHSVYTERQLRCQ